MTTATLETYSISSVLDAPVVAGEHTDMIVRGVKVFKVGRFRNSRGQWGEWTADRLQRAVDNFNALRRMRILPDIPVRLDHTKSMRDVVGYFHELHFDGEFLLADILFTKKTAYDEYQSGHLRNVSLEIGQYETNDEKLYDDVVQGLAFVDIPAVEGLHQRTTGEEMSDENANKEGEGTETPPAAPPAETPPVTPPAETPPPAEQPPAETPPPVDPPAEHRRPTPVETFRVNGLDVNDHAAVQAHIDSLEKFRTDTKASLRASFVDDLVTRGKILGPQKEQFSKHVATLDDDQFAAFREMYDGMPAHNLFGRHDLGQPNGDAAAAQDAADQVAIARETVAQFRRMGRSEEFIQQQPAWATVQKADAAAAAK